MTTQQNFTYVTDPRAVRALVDLITPPRPEPDWDRLLANAPAHPHSTPEYKAIASARAIAQWRHRRERQFGVGP